MTETIKVSDYIIRLLEKQGVKHIYGMIGGFITNLVDSTYGDKGNNIKFINCYHEQAASFAIAAAAKYTNKLQVAMTTSGPGATNLITGICDAYFDSCPILLITGQVNTSDLKGNKGVRQNGFQETDIVNIVKPITKYSVLIDKAENVETEFKKAIRIAISDRPGPVLIDIPNDIQRREIIVSDSSYEIEIDNKVIGLSTEKLQRVVDLLKEAKLPLILSGGGCSRVGSKKYITNFAERLDLPVVVSLMGKDSFDHHHPLFAGFIGSYGNRSGNLLLSKSDVLLVLGSRLDSRQTGNILTPFKDKIVIWVDVDINEINDNLIKPEIVFNTDVNFFLKTLLSRISDVNLTVTRKEYVKLLSYLKKKYAPENELKLIGENNWHYLILKKISKILDDDDVVCVDVGQNQMLSAQTIMITKSQRFINSGGMAPMGYALPAAIGITNETKKRCVVIVGDGGMHVNIQELNSISKGKHNIIIIVLNNSSLGLLRQFQDLYFNSRYIGTDSSSGYHDCNFKEIAQAYGIKSVRINQFTKDINRVLEDLFSNNGSPVLLEVMLDCGSKVYPKLRFDKPLDEISPTLPDDERKKIDFWFENIKKS